MLSSADWLESFYQVTEIDDESDGMPFAAQERINDSYHHDRFRVLVAIKMKCCN
jgi:hypothetical protein